MAVTGERRLPASRRSRLEAAVRGRVPADCVVPTLLFVAAFAARLGVVLRSRGGPRGDFGYDAGVYYASADALVHGRMPYADYLLLHPPALTVVLTPFALLGTVAGDPIGFVTANTVFAALGALNAALVFVLARRVGITRWAAAAGGAVYALWPGAVGSEFLARLEPLGNVFLLAGLLCLARSSRTGTASRWWVLAGVGFGAACVTKIWWLAPLVVVLGWTLRRRAGRRPALLMLGGSVLSAAVIAGPFLVHAPGPMWRMVVLDQLGRPSARGSRRIRLEQLFSLRTALKGTSRPVQFALVLAVLLVLLALGAAAWRVVALRPVVLIGAVQLAVLIGAPTYFSYYSDYLAVALALVVAGAAGSGGRRRGRQWFYLFRHRGRVLAAVVVLATVAGVVSELVVVAPSVVAPFPGRSLAAAVSRAHVRSDSPLALIELDVLSRTLAAGCPDRVDVSGSTYDVDRPARGLRLSRPHNPRWQHDIYAYLTSGNAEITIRGLTGLSPATRRRLARLPVLARAGRFTVRRTP